MSRNILTHKKLDYNSNQLFQIKWVVVILAMVAISHIVMFIEESNRKYDNDPQVDVTEICINNVQHVIVYHNEISQGIAPKVNLDGTFNYCRNVYGISNAQRETNIQ